MREGKGGGWSRGRDLDPRAKPQQPDSVDGRKEEIEPEGTGERSIVIWGWTVE